MPRRALLTITALVLALHWLVLGGIPLAWNHSAAHATGKVFSTRSIALPPPAPVTPVTPAAAPAVVDKPRPVPRPRPAARSAPPTSAVEAPLPAAPALAESAAAPDAADASPAETPAQDSEVTAMAPAEPPVAALPAPAASAPDAPASAPEPAATGAGVDIAAPGAGAGSPASTAPPPVRLPPSTRLGFDVNGQARKFAYSARAELLWQHDGSRYEARQEISAFLVGTRAQRSVGAITAQGLLPERFSDRARSEQAAHFDYTKGSVTFSANTPEAPAAPGVQDRLSVFIQLGALLAADPGRFVPGTRITLNTVSARSADRWTFTIEGPETLELPAGTTPTLKLQRLPRKDYDQKAELWVAPALGYLPVRIRLTQANGDFADLQLRTSGAP